MCNNENKCNNCIYDILKVILLLQQSVCHDNCLETCDKNFFSQGLTSSLNTRPVTIYTCFNTTTSLEMPITKSPTETETSNIFRLEKLDDCCATFRVLVLNPETPQTIQYTTTNSFFTINLNCICLIRCLEDTFVENI